MDLGGSYAVAVQSSFLVLGLEGLVTDRGLQRICLCEGVGSCFSFGCVEEERYGGGEVAPPLPF